MIKVIGQGIGFGFLLVYSIIQKYYGMLEVVSEVGVGSCFCIEILWKQLEVFESFVLVGVIEVVVFLFYVEK